MTSAASSLGKTEGWLALPGEAWLPEPEASSIAAAERD
jgi:hypothetical protein